MTAAKTEDKKLPTCVSCVTGRCTDCGSKWTPANSMTLTELLCMRCGSEVLEFKKSRHANSFPKQEQHYIDAMELIEKYIQDLSDGVRNDCVVCAFWVCLECPAEGRRDEFVSRLSSKPYRCREGHTKGRLRGVKHANTQFVMDHLTKALNDVDNRSREDLAQRILVNKSRKLRRH